MRFRRTRAQNDAAPSAAAAADERLDDTKEDEPALSGTEGEDDADDPDDPDDADDPDDPDAADHEVAEDDPEYDDPQSTGRFAWLKPRKKRIDYGPDFTVKVATLPDLERFPEDGHVHPEIVRSWMALQQFGEAMLLVSWVNRSPAGYVLVSWTGDWHDDVRAKHPDTPALCNLWADERYPADDVEKRLVEAAIKVCQKQGKPSLLATVESSNQKVLTQLEDLGFERTDDKTVERYVYRDASGKKRRGEQENVVLLKEL